MQKMKTIETKLNNMPLALLNIKENLESKYTILVSST
jgi:hypothetical protein